MIGTASIDIAPEARRKPPQARGRCDPSSDRDIDRRKQNLATLPWLRMNVDGSATQGKAERSHPLQFHGCRSEGRI